MLDITFIEQVKAVGRIGSASRRHAGWLCRAASWVSLHGALSIRCESVRAMRGLTVGCFPHVMFSAFGHGLAADDARRE